MSLIDIVVDISQRVPSVRLWGMHVTQFCWAVSLVTVLDYGLTFQQYSCLRVSLRTSLQEKRLNLPVRQTRLNNRSKASLDIFPELPGTRWLPLSTVRSGRIAVRIGEFTPK